MTRSTRSSLILAFCLLALAPAAARAGESVRVGAAITVKKPVSLSKLSKHPDRFKGRTVRLEGTVKDVCQGRGCWVEIESADGASFLAKSLDESILLPMDCKGRRIVLQGLVTALPAAAHAHEKEEAEKGEACPTATYVVSTQGAELIPDR